MLAAAGRGVTATGRALGASGCWSITEQSPTLLLVLRTICLLHIKPSAITNTRARKCCTNACMLQIHNLDNEITKRCPAPDASMSALFYAGTGLLLCRCDDKMVLLDVQQRTSVAELQAPLVKYVVWNTGMTMVALLSKHNVVVADSKLKNSATVHETIRVKSASWNESGVLLYTTLNHIKYCLPGACPSFPGSVALLCRFILVRSSRGAAVEPCRPQQASWDFLLHHPEAVHYTPHIFCAIFSISATCAEHALRGGRCMHACSLSGPPADPRW